MVVLMREGLGWSDKYADAGKTPTSVGDLIAAALVPMRSHGACKTLKGTVSSDVEALITGVFAETGAIMHAQRIGRDCGAPLAREMVATPSQSLSAFKTQLDDYKRLASTRRSDALKEKTSGPGSNASTLEMQELKERLRELEGKKTDTRKERVVDRGKDRITDRGDPSKPEDKAPFDYAASVSMSDNGKVLTYKAALGSRVWDVEKATKAYESRLKDGEELPCMPWMLLTGDSAAQAACGCEHPLDHPSHHKPPNSYKVSDFRSDGRPQKREQHKERNLAARESDRAPKRERTHAAGYIRP